MKPPDIDASEAAHALVTAYDANNDDRLTADEAEACAGLAEQFARYDQDGDAAVTADEIAGRFDSYAADGAGVLRVGCQVTVDGKPLKGATILFEPLPYFGGALQPASGTTGLHGQANVSIAPEDLPPELQRIRGVAPGLYRIRITHPTAEIPAKYNTATTLGQEVAADTIGPQGVRFDLRTR